MLIIIDQMFNIAYIRQFHWLSIYKIRSQQFVEFTFCWLHSSYSICIKIVWYLFDLWLRVLQWFHTIWWAPALLALLFATQSKLECRQFLLTNQNTFRSQFQNLFVEEPAFQCHWSPNSYEIGRKSRSGCSLQVSTYWCQELNVKFKKNYDFAMKLCSFS